MGSCHTWERSNSSSAAAMGKRQPPPTPAPAPALLFLTFNNKTWTLHVDLARTTLRGLQDHVAARTGVPPPAQYLHSGSRPLSARGQLHLRPLATVRLSLRLCGGADRSPAPRSSPTSSDTPLPVAPGNPPDAAAAAAPAAEPDQPREHDPDAAEAAAAGPETGAQDPRVAAEEQQLKLELSSMMLDVVGTIDADAAGGAWVLEVRRIRDDRRFALKWLRSRPELPLRQGLLARLREMRAMQLTRTLLPDHPNLMHVEALGCVGSREYLLLELCKNTLEGRVFCEPRHEPLPPTFVQSLLVQLLAALAAIHSLQLVHRNIHPGSVYCQNERFVLGNFGLSESLALPANAGLPLPAPAVLCPPELDGADPRASAVHTAMDVWAAAATVLLVAIAGTPHLPLPAPKLSELSIDELLESAAATLPQRLGSAALAGLLSDMLARDPAARPSASEALARTSAAVSVPQSFPRLSDQHAEAMLLVGLDVVNEHRRCKSMLCVDIYRELEGFMQLVNEQQLAAHNAEVVARFYYTGALLHLQLLQAKLAILDTSVRQPPHVVAEVRACKQGFDELLRQAQQHAPASFGLDIANGKALASREMADFLLLQGQHAAAEAEAQAALGEVEQALQSDLNKADKAYTAFQLTRNFCQLLRTWLQATAEPRARQGKIPAAEEAAAAPMPPPAENDRIARIRRALTMITTAEQQLDTYVNATQGRRPYRDFWALQYEKLQLEMEGGEAVGATAADIQGSLKKLLDLGKADWMLHARSLSSALELATRGGLPASPETPQSPLRPIRLLEQLVTIYETHRSDIPKVLYGIKNARMHMTQAMAMTQAMGLLGLFQRASTILDVADEAARKASAAEASASAHPSSPAKSAPGPAEGIVTLDRAPEADSPPESLPTSVDAAAAAADARPLSATATLSLHPALHPSNTTLPLAETSLWGSEVACLLDRLAAEAAGQGGAACHIQQIVQPDVRYSFPSSRVPLSDLPGDAAPMAEALVVLNAGCITAYFTSRTSDPAAPAQLVMRDPRDDDRRIAVAPDLLLALATLWRRSTPSPAPSPRPPLVLQTTIVCNRAVLCVVPVLQLVDGRLVTLSTHDVPILHLLPPDGPALTLRAMTNAECGEAPDLLPAIAALRLLTQLPEPHLAGLSYLPHAAIAVAAMDVALEFPLYCAEPSPLPVRLMKLTIERLQLAASQVEELCADGDNSIPSPPTTAVGLWASAAPTLCRVANPDSTIAAYFDHVRVELANLLELLSARDFAAIAARLDISLARLTRALHAEAQRREQHLSWEPQTITLSPQHLPLDVICGGVHLHFPVGAVPATSAPVALTLTPASPPPEPKTLEALLREAQSSAGALLSTPLVSVDVAKSRSSTDSPLPLAKPAWMTTAVYGLHRSNIVGGMHAFRTRLPAEGPGAFERLRVVRAGASFVCPSLDHFSRVGLALILDQATVQAHLCTRISIAVPSSPTSQLQPTVPAEGGHLEPDVEVPAADPVDAAEVARAANPGPVPLTVLTCAEPDSITPPFSVVHNTLYVLGGSRDSDDVLNHVPDMKIYLSEHAELANARARFQKHDDWLNGESCRLDSLWAVGALLRRGAQMSQSMPLMVLENILLEHLGNKLELRYSQAALGEPWPDGVDLGPLCVPQNQPSLKRQGSSLHGTDLVDSDVDMYVVLSTRPLVARDRDTTTGCVQCFWNEAESAPIGEDVGRALGRLFVSVLREYQSTQGLSIMADNFDTVCPAGLAAADDVPPDTPAKDRKLWCAVTLSDGTDVDLLPVLPLLNGGFVTLTGRGEYVYEPAAPVTREPCSLPVVRLLKLCARRPMGLDTGVLGVPVWPTKLSSFMLDAAVQKTFQALREKPDLVETRAQSLAGLVHFCLCTLQSALPTRHPAETLLAPGTESLDVMAAMGLADDREQAELIDAWVTMLMDAFVVSPEQRGDGNDDPQGMAMDEEKVSDELLLDFVRRRILTSVPAHLAALFWCATISGTLQTATFKKTSLQNAEVHMRCGGLHVKVEGQSEEEQAGTRPPLSLLLTIALRPVYLLLPVPAVGLAAEVDGTADLGLDGLGRLRVLEMVVDVMKSRGEVAERISRQVLGEVSSRLHNPPAIAISVVGGEDAGEEDARREGEAAGEDRRQELSAHLERLAKTIVCVGGAGGDGNNGNESLWAAVAWALAGQPRDGVTTLQAEFPIDALRLKWFR